MERQRVEKKRKEGRRGLTQQILLQNLADSFTSRKQTEKKVRKPVFLLPIPFL